MRTEERARARASLFSQFQSSFLSTCTSDFLHLPAKSLSAVATFFLGPWRFSEMSQELYCYLNGKVMRKPGRRFPF